MKRAKRAEAVLLTEACVGFARDIQDMGALSKLDISSNDRIPQQQQSQIRQICEAKSVVCTL